MHCYYLPSQQLSICSAIINRSTYAQANNSSLRLCLFCLPPHPSTKPLTRVRDFCFGVVKLAILHRDVPVIPRGDKCRAADMYVSNHPRRCISRALLLRLGQCDFTLADGCRLCTAHRCRHPASSSCTKIRNRNLYLGIVNAAILSALPCPRQANSGACLDAWNNLRDIRQIVAAAYTSRQSICEK
eukprot:scaffold235742_cov26-Prasinocladus_malaysianus.AAC.1